jgi:hypothetical protein
MSVNHLLQIVSRYRLGTGFDVVTELTGQRAEAPATPPSPLTVTEITHNVRARAL